MEHVYLIPGFFGFANFGEIRYFTHVEARIEREFLEAGRPVKVHFVRQLPTSTLPRRAARLADNIFETAGDQGGIHLVGHSTGGIDARLFTTPGVDLPTAVRVEALASRVRTIVSVVSPHQGTPQVDLFSSSVGSVLLRALSVMTLHSIRLGSVPATSLLTLAGGLARIGRFDGPMSRVLDQLNNKLLKDFDGEAKGEVETFFREASEDQGLLGQLGPNGMDVLNAAAGPRPGVRYGCVVAQAKPPTWGKALSIGLSPSFQASYALYRALYRLAAMLPSNTVPKLNPEQRQALTEAYGEVPKISANDAIVPTLSQVYGHVVHATWGDHLDVIGHFHDPHSSPPHVDWLPTRSNFVTSKFEALWRDVGEFLVGE